MEREAFELRQGFDRLANGGGCLPRRADELHRLQERLQAEAAHTAGDSARREDVVGAGRVVAEHSRRAQEDRARIAHAGDEGIRVGDEQLEVLGRELVRARDRVVEGVHRLERARPFVRARTSSAMRVLVVTRIASPSGPCSAWASRSAAHSSGSAVSSAITSTSLGPAGKVDRDVPGDEQLRLGHPAVARADDLGDRRDRLRAIGERGDRLRAAHRPDLVDPELPRRREHRRRGRGVATAIRGTPATRAGTAVITSDESRPAGRRCRPSPAAASGARPRSRGAARR